VSEVRFSVLSHTREPGVRACAYIEDVHATFIYKEALKQALYDDQAFAQDQYYRVDPRTPTMEDRKEGILR
jgi:hypothetical protein